MSLCSLEQVLDACDTPEWSVDSSTINLRVIRGPIRFASLRELEAFDTFATDFSHSSETTLQPQYDSGSEGELPNDSLFTLRLPRVVSRFVVAKNLADLLSVASATWRIPQEYFLVKEEESDTPFCFTANTSLDNVPKLVKRYHKAIALWTLLQSLADHTTDTQSLMFFGIRRTEIEATYAIPDLEAED